MESALDSTAYVNPLDVALQRRYENSQLKVKMKMPDESFACTLGDFKV